MIARLKAFLAKVTRYGVKPTTPSARQRSIVLTNILSLLFSATIAFFVLLFYATSLHSIAEFCIVFSAMLLLPILLNYRGKNKTASCALIVIANLMGVYLCMMIGPEAQIQAGFVCLIGVSLILFDAQNPASLLISLLGFTLSISCYLVADRNHFDLLGGIKIDGEQIDKIHLGVGVTYFLVVFLEFYYLQYVNSRLSADKEHAQVALLSSAKLTALGEMANQVAHEINNPLMVIGGRSALVRNLLLKNPIDTATATRSLENIEVMVSRISKIIQGMRVISHNADHDPLELVNLKSVVNDTVTFCTDNLKQASIDIRCLLPEDEVTVVGRGSQIAQALVNLINNAKDAIAELKEKWVLVTLRVSNDAVEISVMDSGEGIPSDLKERIFYPFFTTKASGKSPGLGLSVSKGLVEQQGGTLKLDSASRHTCFVIQLPNQENSQTIAV